MYAQDPLQSPLLHKALAPSTALLCRLKQQHHCARQLRLPSFQEYGRCKGQMRSSALPLPEILGQRMKIHEQIIAGPVNLTFACVQRSIKLKKNFAYIGQYFKKDEACGKSTSKEHGHVGVVAAGMHLARLRALEGHIDLLLHAWQPTSSDAPASLRMDLRYLHLGAPSTGYLRHVQVVFPGTRAEDCLRLSRMLWSPSPPQLAKRPCRS